tara:strand:- start:105 stop:566 length:462 start_codon:yes stop_codon:yes gene_type:complete
MKDMKNYHFTIDEMHEALINIKKQINKTEWFPEQILSVNRGGCVPGVYLSHAINVPHKVLDVQLRYDNNNPNLEVLRKSIISSSNILIIDDINDTGATFEFIKKSYDSRVTNIRYAALIDNISSSFKVNFRGKKIDKSSDSTWIIFPWEKEIG